MIVLFVLLLVLTFTGVGFAVHFLRFVAFVAFVLWLVGLAKGRGRGGRHRFYRW